MQKRSLSVNLPYKIFLMHDHSDSALVFPKIKSKVTQYLKNYIFHGILNLVIVTFVLVQSFETTKTFPFCEIMLQGL